METESIQAELTRILTSPLFAHAKRQRQFLEFVVGETLAGRADRISSYTVGVKVFDRDQSFDPMLDPIVRVGAGRLRAKLREYYDGEGRSSPIRIGLNKGSYAATICGRRSDPAEGAGQTPVEPEEASLAVLPFASDGDIPGHQRFVDGLTEDVITDLSKLSGLFLISWHASHTYERTQEPAETIARKLGVHYLLEGNLRLAGGRVRVSAQLVDALSSQVLWGERYDRELGDDFNIQDDLAHSIVEAIRTKLVKARYHRNGRGLYDSD
jgi:adenylate cyclase